MELFLFLSLTETESFLETESYTVKETDVLVYTVIVTFRCKLR